MSVAGVAHPVERHLAKVEVASSSLVTRSIKEPMRLHRFFCFIGNDADHLNASLRRQRNNITGLVTRSHKEGEAFEETFVTRLVRGILHRRPFLSLKKYEIILIICLTNAKILI